MDARKFPGHSVRRFEWMFFMAKCCFDFCLSFGRGGLRRLCKPASLGMAARYYLSAKTGLIWVQLNKNMVTTELQVMWRKMLIMNFYKSRP